MRQAVRVCSGGQRRTAAASLGLLLLLLLQLVALQVCTAAEALECEACDVPTAHKLSFCADMVVFSACLPPGATWASMDAEAETEYTQRLNASSLTDSVANDAGCALALRRVSCLRVFNLCEIGAAEPLCRASCSLAVTTNCSVALSSTQEETVATTFCGSNATSSSRASTSSYAGLSTSDVDKCFVADYRGPKHSAWVAGFIIAVVFSFLASVGINLQKRALKQNETTAFEHNREPRPAYKLPLWNVGFVLIILGSILDFVAFGLAPQSLLAPLAALTLVWNMILAPCFNKEKLTRKDIVATLVIFAGATLAVVFASHTSPSYNLDMLLRLYDDPLTCAYFVFVFLCILLHLMLILMVEKLSLMSRRHRLIQVGRPATWSTVRLVGYSGFAGTMGGQSVLFAKSCAEMLKAAFHGDNACFLRFEGYLITFALVACLLCQIHYLNRGLSYYDALSIVPVYQAYWIISGVLGGVIYFQEIRAFSIDQACMFVLGIATTIFGVVLLSRRKHSAVLKRKATFERGFSFSGPTSVSIASGSSMKPGSGGTQLAVVAEVSSQVEDATDTEGEDGGDQPMHRHHAASTRRGRVDDDAVELSTTEESDEGANSEDDEDEDGPDGAAVDGTSGSRRSRHTANRQAIDNYLDMSTTACLTELFGGLGFQGPHSGGLLYRRPSTRILTSSGRGGSGRRSARRSVDDIEVGLPAAARDGDNPRERVGGKRRSITFTSYLSSLASSSSFSSAPSSSEAMPAASSGASESQEQEALSKREEDRSDGST